MKRRNKKVYHEIVKERDYLYLFVIFIVCNFFIFCALMFPLALYYFTKNLIFLYLAISGFWIGNFWTYSDGVYDHKFEKVKHIIK